MTARIAGYVTRKEWGAAPPKDTTPLNGRRMAGAAVHHGGGYTPTTHAGCITAWKGYQTMHLRGDRGPQNDIAYNLGVCQHGYAFEGRGWLLQGGANGTREANRSHFSVCVIGTGRVAATPAARDAVEWCILQFRARGNAGLQVKWHAYFYATSCPGPELLAFAKTLDGKPIGTADPITDPGTPGTVRKGDRGSQVVVVQEYLAALGYDVGKVDGVAGALFDAAVRAFQTNNGLDVDGVAGPNTLTQLRSKEAVMARLHPDDINSIVTQVARAVRNLPVRRANDPNADENGHVTLIQEIADSKTAAQANTAELAALKAAIVEGGKGGPLDLDVIVAAAEEGAGRALDDLRLVKGDDQGGVRDIEDVDQMTKEA